MERFSKAIHFLASTDFSTVLDCSQSTIFPWDRRCRSLSSTGRRWSLDASKTGESTKRPWVEVVGLIALSWRGGKKSKIIGKKENFFARSALHHPYPRVFSTFPVLLASRDQDRCSFKSTINIYDLTEKLGTEQFTTVANNDIYSRSVRIPSNVFNLVTVTQTPL